MKKKKNLKNIGVICKSKTEFIEDKNTNLKPRKKKPLKNLKNKIMKIFGPKEANEKYWTYVFNGISLSRALAVHNTDHCYHNTHEHN